MPFRPALAVAFATLVAVAPVLAAPVYAAAAPSPAVAAPAEDVAVAPKVVIVVGATESTTASYRSMADSIAAEAVKWTPNVVKVYSPNATWAVVKAAAQGASIFVYLGHGNGFPSPYGSTLVPDKVDGMGLNTTMGLSDSDKKYFGESCIDGLAAASSSQCPNNGNGIRFADNAIVFLNHLCYAPGAGEPGAPEPTVTTAEQRVDNFASGFIRAGARAVVADDYLSTVPDMIKAIFSTHQSILTSWRTTWGYHGNEIPFVPARNPAFQGILDPETWTTGFKRSIVTDANLTTDQIVAGAAKAPTNLAPSTLAVPGAASVVTAGLPVDTAADLATAQATLPAGTKLRVDGLVAGNPPPDAVQVHTLDNAVSGWVSSAGVAPADSSSPELWALTGSTTVSPNFDGASDHLDLWGRLSEAVPWTFTVTDGGGTVLRTQAGSADLFAVTWDALPGGSPAPAGTYHWTLHATDAWGNAPLDATGDITVTNQAIPTTAVLAFKGLNGTYTNAATLGFQVTFASAVTGFTAGDLIRGGTATGCVINAPTGGPTTWSFTVSSCSAGSVTLTLKANSVLDAALAAGPSFTAAGPYVRIDRTKPTATAPKTGFKSGGVITGATLPVTVSWTGADNSGGVGVVSYDVARSVDGGAFTVIATATPATSLATTVSSGHAYRYEARSRDRAGNVGAWVAGSTLHPSIVQHTAAGFTWSGAWTTQSAVAYSGGSARVASAAGASVAYTFTGRGFAVVASRDATNGQFKVYVDGTYVVTVDTTAASHADRVVVYARALTWATHTVKLVVVGTAGRPTVVFDALEVLR